jgi:hypothetical protein
MKATATAEATEATTMAVVPEKRRCVPSQGQHPGEVHEALVSWTDQRTQSVRLTVRHVGTGDVSEVDLFKTKFGKDE